MNIKLISIIAGSFLFLSALLTSYIYGRSSREAEVQQYKQQLVLLNQVSILAQQKQKKIETDYKKSVSDLQKKEQALVAQLKGLDCNQLVDYIRTWIDNNRSTK